MAATSENKPKQYISVGILAHVDAGKTTLSEGILYLTGQIRKLGRVDHGDAFLDTYTLERSRGITIFSKQANFVLGDKQVTLLDTPGHVDFSAEMERTLQVLDYAILVVSGADGVQGHTRTLWNLLARYQVPTFIFINKMDQDGTDRQDRLTELKRKLSGECVDFTEAGEEFLEELSIVRRDGNGKLSGKWRDHGEPDSDADPGTKGISMLFRFGTEAGRCAGITGRTGKIHGRTGKRDAC